MTTLRFLRTAGILASLAAAFPAVAAAQIPVAGGTLYREFDLGGRTFTTAPNDTSAAFFQLYRQVNSGLVVPNARVWFVSEDGRTYADAWTRTSGGDDQRWRALLSRSGAWKFSFAHDETPHSISSDARMLGTISETGDTLSLPAVRPDTGAWNAAGLLPMVGFQNTTNRAQLVITPASDWTVRADAERTSREGNRPMGMAFGTPGGPVREILEPLSQTLDRFRIAPSISRPTWQAQLSYEYSGFDNEYPAVVADNPTLAASTATTGTATGRTALAPSNHAQTLAASGALHTGSMGHLAMSASYSWRSQDQAFVPRTSNPMLDTLTGFSALPKNLAGDVRTGMFNVGWSGRVDPKVSLTARYTYFSLDDQTPDVTFIGRAVTDRSVSIATLERESYSYSRQMAVGELSWRPRREATIRLSDNWQVVSRNAETREVATTTEHTPKLALDVTPLDWLTLRTSYRIGTRVGSNYNSSVSPDNSPAMRLYDEADRTLHRFDIGAEVDPLPNTSVGFQVSNTRTRYDGTLYGLSRDDNDALALDGVWSPGRGLSVSAGAGLQTYRMRIGNQMRTAAQPNNATWSWMTDETDTVVSANLQVNAAVIDKTLDVGFGGTYMRSTTSLHNWNPIPPSLADAATLAQVRAADFPEIYFRQVLFSVVARYHIDNEWTVSARYSTEDVKSWDFRSDNLLQAVGGQYYLGNNPPFYGAGYFTFTVSYRPWIPGLRRGLY